ncbi:EF-hand domain-containing protein [Thermomonas hydrothermalis]|uniref:EF hand n=1 Tax=Thermomonas hydrothermalis TaxID=213588 RepID=A0A1M4XJ68_9GAMM|nr:EF-hand domain-containing protein [Thermomonas hydrothermalis]SHE93436.1 EF hand [Thermomonas hydrothermalis]
MKRLHLMLLALTTTMASAAAIAQVAPPPAPPAAPPAPPASPMQRVDANGDGVITRDEAAKFPRLAARFDQLDKNKDGKLTSDELPARHWRQDGQPPMDRQQWQQRMAEQRAECFDKADSNKDGKLSREEFDKIPQVCHPMGEHRQRPPMPDKAPPPPAPGK